MTEAIFDTLHDILFMIKDRSRRYIAVNEAFVLRAGVRHRTEILGRTAREVFPAILVADYEWDDDEVLSKDVSVHYRREMITQPDGTVGWFVSQKVPVKSLSGETIAIIGISRGLETSATHGRELGTLAGSLETLHRDIAQPLRIEELARQAGLSLSQFQRRVHKIIGLTPRQLLTKARIDNAAHALRETEKSLMSIAVECGFYDQAAFSRQFSAATGLTPGEYRRAFHKL